MFGISSAVAVSVEDLCQCNFTSIDVTVSFQCQSTSDRCVNVNLLYNSEISNQSTARFVRNWVESTASITILSDRLSVTSECAQSPTPTTPSTTSTTGSSVNTTAIIWGVVIGVPAAIILILVMIAIIVYCVKKKKHQNAAQQDFDDNIYEIISDFNTRQDAEE